MTISKTETADLARQATLDDLTNAWLDARAEREKIDSRIADLDAQILDLLPPGESHSLPGLPDVGIKVQGPKRSLDQERAKAMLDPATYAAVSELVVRSDKLKDAVPGYLVDLIMQPSATGKRSVQAIRTARR